MKTAMKAKGRDAANNKPRNFPILLSAVATNQHPAPRIRYSATAVPNACPTKVAGANMEDIRPGRVPFSPDKTWQALPGEGVLLLARLWRGALGLSGSDT